MLGLLTVLAALAALSLRSSGDEPAQKKKEAGGAGQEPTIARPTTKHALLKKEVGIWDATVKAWMNGPGAPPEESKGVETNRLLGDGLWLVTDFQSEFFDQPFRGHGTFGYDHRKGKYVGTWVDSMADHIDLSEGTYDEARQTLTMHSDTVDPASGKPVKTKQVTEFQGEGSRLFTFFMVGPDGKDIKVMEIRYTRRKS